MSRSGPVWRSYGGHIAKDVPDHEHEPKPPGCGAVLGIVVLISAVMVAAWFAASKYADEHPPCTRGPHVVRVAGDRYVACLIPAPERHR